MEITKREILASITIIAVMLILGFVIAGRIDAHQIQKNSEYYKAVQITESEQFRYGMDTSVGNAFVYGTLEAVDPVTYPEIGGQYLYVEKVEEHYNMHTRTVTTSDGKGHVQTRVETYWSWDWAGEEDIHSQRIRFLNVEMDYRKIQMPSEDYIDTSQESSYVRFKYYGVPITNTGTIYADLRDGTISDDSRFFVDTDIESAVKSMTTSWIWLFWVVWLLLTGAVVFGFYYLDNNWLEDGNESMDFKIRFKHRHIRNGSRKGIRRW